MGVKNVQPSNSGEDLWITHNSFQRQFPSQIDKLRGKEKQMPSLTNLLSEPFVQLLATVEHESFSL